MGWRQPSRGRQARWETPARSGTTSGSSEGRRRASGACWTGTPGMAAWHPRRRRPARSSVPGPG
eukprot:3458574-Lingulodinium_polyedra.AAC.1